MKVLFVHPPHTGFDRNQLPSPTFMVSRLPPLSGITLAAFLRKYGHEVCVIDGQRITVQFGNVRAQVYEELLRMAIKFNPELIAVTILTADFSESAQAIKLLRSVLPKAKIIAGGPHPSGEPVATLEQLPELDAIGIGPGEDICLDMACGKEISEIPGCAFLKDGQAVFTQKRNISKDIDAIPFPAWDLIDGDYYSEMNLNSVFGFLTRSITVLTSRGCPGNCTFCSSQWNRPLRLHSAAYVLDFCEYLADRYPIDTINFGDDTLAILPQRLVELCEGFLKRGLHKRLKWRAQLRADQVESGLLKLMKEANCFYVTFGTESGSDRVLKMLNKGITVSQNLNAIDSIYKAGLFFGTSIILGSPGETEKDLAETFSFCQQIPCESIGVCRFSPLPGSPAYARLVKEGRLNPRDVNWELLGNFSLSDGPVFSDMDPVTFRNLFLRIRAYCEKRNTESFIRNHKERYPEIVNLLYPANNTSRLGKFTKVLARKFIPTRIRQYLRKVADA